MKKFIFCFIIAGRSEETGRARIYATPVYNAPEYIRITKIYKPTRIKDGDGWAVLHLTAWAAGGLKAGTYLIHISRGLVFRLSGDACYLNSYNLRSLAGYAESKYAELKIYQNEKIRL